MDFACFKIQLVPTGVVTFTRRSVSEPQLPQWEECQTTFADSLLHVSDDGTIEDDGEGLLQADFANKVNSKLKPVVSTIFFSK